MDKKLAVAVDTLPIFRGCGRFSLAKLIPHARSTSLAAGERLFEVGQTAHDMFYLVSGEIALYAEQRVVSTLSSGFIGEESCTGGVHYMSAAVATASCQLIVFPNSAIKSLIKENPQVGVDLNLSLLGHFVHQTGSEPVVKPESKVNISSAWLETIGWILAIILPAMAFLGTSAAGMTFPVSNFITIFTVAIIMWLFNLVPEYVPAIFVIMATLILGLVPTSVVLSGYSSGPFFMALSFFGIGAVLVGSGVTYRFALAVLRRIPATSFAYDMALFFLGVLLTPILPSSNGRTVLLTPLLAQISDTVGYRRLGIATTRLSAATFAGLSLFASSFMTAKSVNFVLIGLLPIQTKDQFSAGYWFYAALATSLLLFVGHLLLSALLFRSEERIQLSSNQLVEQMRILGPMNPKEWIAFACVVSFIIGIMTSSIHKIDPPWIGLALLFVILTTGAISRNDFRKVIDWPFLLLLGAFVGIEKSVSFLQIDKWLALHLVFIRDIMSSNIYLFIIILAVVTYVIRLIIPASVAVILLAAFLMPMASSIGMNPWIIGFIILLFSDGWLFPYQCTYYIQMVQMAVDPPLFDQKLMLRYNILMNFVRVAAIFVSVPYWKAIGLL